MIDLNKQYLEKSLIPSASTSLLSLIKTDSIDINTLYESWLDFEQLNDNPYSLAVFCSILWNLYDNMNLVKLEIIQKRSNWSKFYIIQNSIKGHIIKVHPCTEQAIEYYRKNS